MKNMLLVAAVLFSFFAIAQTPVKIGCLSGNCQTGIGKYRFKDLSIYEGQWKNAVQDGQGTISLPSGSYYKGSFKAGKMHGKGKFQLSNGDFFEGDFKEDVFEGQGSYTFKDGTKMGGTYVNYKLVNGWLAGKDGTRYDGEFQNGQKMGKGMMRYADSTVYLGDWKNGKRNGTGVAKDKSGNIVYEGQWVDDAMLHPELSVLYKEEKLKLYADVFKSIYEGFQQMKIKDQKGACSLEINFNLEGKDYKMHGFAIVTLKVDGKDYTKKALIEGTIDPLTNTINAKETLYLSKDELPSQLKWNQATYQLTIYTDSDHVGHYFLKGVSKDENAFLTALKEKNLPK